MTTKATSASVDLLAVAKQLELVGKKLQSEVEKTGRPLGIAASVLAAKIPDLKVLDDLKIFQMRKVEKEFKVNCLTVFRNEDGTCDIYTPELDVVNDFEITSYKTGIGGHTKLKHKSGLELRASISWNDNHLIELEELEQDGLEGEGIPPVSVLRDLPRPETPLSSPYLPLNEEITILSNGNFSKEHNTPLINVKLKNGNVLKDVICNTSLHRMYEKYGDGMKFKIANKKQVQRKNSKAKDSKAEDSKAKDNNKLVWVVDIIDCQIDFSDL